MANPWAMLVVAVLGVAVTASAQAPPPNIVVIVGDDHAWTDSGFMGSTRPIPTNQGPLPIHAVVQTPNLDALAAGGVTFRMAQNTASVCIPSLRSVLSAAGMQPFQWESARAALDALPQITLPGPPLFFPRRESEHLRMLPRELRPAGYLSWEGGKMWEGTFTQAGFTHGLAIDHGTFFSPDGDRFGRTEMGWDPASCGPSGAPGVPCPALDPLRDFLDEAGDQPFFVWFAPSLPHTPFSGIPSVFRAPYEALGIEECAGWNLECNRLGYLANVAWLDALVGELIAELEARDLRENTLVLYFSDNGWDWSGAGKGKGTLYELGFRTPIVFNQPGHVPAGVVYDDLVSTTDIPATILDYAGVDPLPEQEGLSLRDRIENGTPIGRTGLAGLHPGLGHFLRTSQWRYLRFASDGHEELYRIDLDPFETNDLAAANPTLVQGLRIYTDLWEADRRSPPSQVEIAGQALDPTTLAPLAGAQIQLLDGPFPLVSIAGSDGSFRFGPVPAGSYRVATSARVTNLTWLGTAAPVASTVPLATSGLWLNLRGTRTVTLPGPTSAQIRGLVTNTAGTPLAGVRIDVTGAVGCEVVQTRVVTRADGTYRAENLPFATYTVSATAPPGLANATATVVVDDVDVFPGNLVLPPA